MEWIPRMNGPLTTKEAEFIVTNNKNKKVSLKKKSPCLYGLTGEYTKCLKRHNRNSTQFLPENRKEGNISQFIL